MSIFNHLNQLRNKYYLNEETRRNLPKIFFFKKYIK